MPDLSQREKEILRLIAQEFSRAEIAKQLFISKRTYDNHRQQLLKKLNVSGTAGLVKAAIKMGLIEL